MHREHNDLYTSEKQTKKGLQIHSDFPIQPPVIVYITAVILDHSQPPSLSLSLSHTVSVIHQTRLAFGP